jgi:hypothetical protein
LAANIRHANAKVQFVCGGDARQQQGRYSAKNAQKLMFHAALSL